MFKSEMILNDCSRITSQFITSEASQTDAAAIISLEGDSLKIKSTTLSLSGSLSLSLSLCVCVCACVVYVASTNFILDCLHLKISENGENRSKEE